MEHETRRRRRIEIAASDWPTNQGLSMFGARPPPPPPPPPRPRELTGLSRNLCALAENHNENNPSAKRIHQVTQVTAQAKKRAAKVARAGWRKSKEVTKELKSEIKKEVNHVTDRVKQFSSGSSFDSSSNSEEVRIVSACPASFHPAFMHGDKLSAVPGLHPPSYEDALRDPVEPPTYAQPPPTPPTRPPPPSSDQSSGPYGHPQRASVEDAVYDIGGISANIYDNHQIDNKGHYDQAGVTAISARKSVTNITPPQLPPRNKLTNHSIERVESTLTTVTQLEPQKSLKRTISDPIQVTDPFIMASPMAEDPFRVPSPPQPEVCEAPRPKARTKLTPTPPPRKSLHVLTPEVPEPISRRVKTPPLECHVNPGPRVDCVSLVEPDRLFEIKESIYALEAELAESDHGGLELEQRRLKLETRHSLRQMKNELLRKVKFPYLVRAAGAQISQDREKLNFEKSDHLIVSDLVGVSQRDGQKWFVGEHTETGEKGIFPEDMVVRVTDDEPLDTTIWV